MSLRADRAIVDNRTARYRIRAAVDRDCRIHKISVLTAVPCAHLRELPGGSLPYHGYSKPVLTKRRHTSTLPRQRFALTLAFAPLLWLAFHSGAFRDSWGVLRMGRNLARYNSMACLSCAGAKCDAKAYGRPSAAANSAP